MWLLLGTCGCVPTAGASVGTEHLPRAVRGGGEADPWQPGFLFAELPGAGAPGILLPILNSDLSLYPEDASGSPWPCITPHPRLGRP